MDSTERDHFATITTPAGSVVHIPNLTETEADAIARQIGPPPRPLPRPDASATDQKDCGKCGGDGYWYEEVETETPSGSKVTTKKRVNCRPCGGTGKLPK